MYAQPQGGKASPPRLRRSRVYRESTRAQSVFRERQRHDDKEATRLSHMRWTYGLAQLGSAMLSVVRSDVPATMCVPAPSSRRRGQRWTAESMDSAGWSLRCEAIANLYDGASHLLSPTLSRRTRGVLGWQLGQQSRDRLARNRPQPMTADRSRSLRPDVSRRHTRGRWRVWRNVLATKLRRHRRHCCLPISRQHRKRRRDTL